MKSETKPALPNGPDVTSRPPSQAAIARALGVSPALVTKLKKTGMPVTSVKAARTWRALNVNAYTSGARKSQEVNAVKALVPCALAAVQAGRFSDVEADLRRALRAVPDRCADEVALPVEVWDALTDDVYRAIAQGPTAANPSPMSDEESRVMGRFWIAAARGLFGRLCEP